MAQNTAPRQTALETFELRKANILKMARSLESKIREYDLAISSQPGGHQDWGHAGTLQNIEDLLANAHEALASATENTLNGNRRRVNLERLDRQRGAA